MAGIKLARVGGPKPTVEAKPTFQYEVGKDEDVGEYKVGMFLKEPRVLKDFFAMQIGAAGDEAKATALREADNAQVMEVLKAVDLSSSEDSPLQQYVTAIMNAKFMLLNLDEIPSRASLEVEDPEGAYHWGAMAGADIDGLLTTSVAHAKEADACPILLRVKLVARFGNEKTKSGTPVMRAWPPMRSQYKGDGAKGNRAPWGYRLPSERAEDNPLPAYNGPWMKDKKFDLGTGGDVQRDWAANFTAALPTGKYWYDMVEVLKTKGVPEVWPASLSKEDQDLIKLHKNGNDSENKVATMLKNAAYEFNKRKSWVIAAIELDQAIDRIQTRFTHVRVDSYGQKKWKQTAEDAAKRRDPFCLSVQDKDADGETERVYSGAIAKGKVISIAKRAHTMAPVSSIAVLLAPPPRKTPENGADTKTTEKPSVTSTDGLLDVLQAINVYVDVDGRRNTIMAKISGKDGGLLASTLRGVCADLVSIAEDPAVQKIADAWDKAQNEAVAAAANAA